MAFGETPMRSASRPKGARTRVGDFNEAMALDPAVMVFGGERVAVPSWPCGYEIRCTIQWPMVFADFGIDQAFARGRRVARAQHVLAFQTTIFRLAENSWSPLDCGITIKLGEIGDRSRVCIDQWGGGDHGVGPSWS
jgi:hypothetical protein